MQPAEIYLELDRIYKRFPKSLPDSGVSQAYFETFSPHPKALITRAVSTVLANSKWPPTLEDFSIEIRKLKGPRSTASVQTYKPFNPAGFNRANDVVEKLYGFRLDDPRENPKFLSEGLAKALKTRRGRDGSGSDKVSTGAAGKAYEQGDKPGGDSRNPAGRGE